MTQKRFEVLLNLTVFDRIRNRNMYVCMLNNYASINNVKHETVSLVQIQTWPNLGG